MEDYKWVLSVPMIRIMSIDNTRIHYLSDNAKEKSKARKKAINSAEDLFADFGIPLSDLNKNNENQS